MRTAFFSWITDNWINTTIDYDNFYNSFKKFHPDIDLIVFKSKDFEGLVAQKPWINSDNCKASFAKLLYNDYDLLVNVDTDFYFFDRLEEVLAGDYDIAACANFNNLCNVNLAGGVIDGYDIPSVSEVNYIQGGLIASTKKEFWDDYDQISKDLAKKLPLRENDTLNAIWHSNKYKVKVLDGDVDFRSANFKQYYNCASLNEIHNAKIIDDKVYLNGKPMRSYHVAHGHQHKPRIDEIFPKDVSNWFYNKVYGK